MAQEKEASKRRERAIRNAGLGGAHNEVVQRYGSAAKEHLVAYTGVDRETGQVLKKSLDSISKEKLSEEYLTQTVRAQAGYAAEVKTAARDNAEAIISGRSTRVSRTDDLPKDLTGADGQTIGGVNNQLYDIVSVGPDGSYIEGSARQLKYVGKDADECCKQLMQKKFDKYRDADAQIEVPKDFYDGVRKELDARIDKVRDQLKRAEQDGRTTVAQKHREQLERLQKTKQNLRKGRLTCEEAVEARLRPRLSTTKDVALLSHRAGVEAAKTGAIIGGGMSFIQNCVAVVKGDKDAQDAALDVLGDTASAAGLSYATGFVGSAVKGGLQNAESIYAQALSKTALPAMIAGTVVETCRTMYRFFDGQIDGTQCLTELGEKGSGTVASTAGAVVGQILIPIPVLGGLVGGMCGYVLSSVFYGALTSALQDAKHAREERKRIEAECEQAIASIREYRMQMELVIRNYMQEHIRVFDRAVSDMHRAFRTGDVDLVIGSANAITEQLGNKPLFRTQDEFDEIMMGSDILFL